MMWAASAIFALIGPPIVGQLVAQYGINAVGYWTGCNLFVAVMLVGSAVLMEFYGDKNRCKSNQKGSPSLESTKGALDMEEGVS